MRFNSFRSFYFFRRSTKAVSGGSTRYPLGFEFLEDRTLLSVYDPAADFSSTQNPNGPWSYGQASALGSTFELYTDLAQSNWGGFPVSVWRNVNQPELPGYPLLAHNDSNSLLEFDNVVVAPGGLNFHPGPNGELSIIRWTAPFAAPVSIDGFFGANERQGWPPTTSDVQILHNNTSIFASEIDGHAGTGVSFTDVVDVLPGDTLDFAVGWGSNQDFAWDNTGLSVTLVADQPDVLDVEIDIKPGSDPNSINLSSNGKIAVAIFTTDDFDATQVDASSVMLGGALAVQSDLDDVDGDGDLDMVLHFNTQDTDLLSVYQELLIDDLDGDGVLDSSNQETEVSLTGETLTDQAFEGVDDVNLFLKGKALRDLLEELFS